VDYVIASHVAEHVPDLITWLEEVRNVLRERGTLRLVLPDRRYGFDYLRAETRLKDVLTPYIVRARRPTVEQIVDFYANVADGVDGWGIVNGTFNPANVKRRHDIHWVREAAHRILANPDHYEDVHCWTFTPFSFAALMAAIARFGILKLACTRLEENGMPLLDFTVFMSPCDDQQQIIESWSKRVARQTNP
jgi:hypothetical protein